MEKSINYRTRQRSGCTERRRSEGQSASNKNGNPKRIGRIKPLRFAAMHRYSIAKRCPSTRSRLIRSASSRASEWSPVVRDVEHLFFVAFSSDIPNVVRNATVFRTKKRASGETLALLAQLKVREHTVSY
jgi:hypothetical protein